MSGKVVDAGKEWDDGERRVMKGKGIGYIWEYVIRENKCFSYLFVKFYFDVLGAHAGSLKTSNMFFGKHF